MNDVVLACQQLTRVYQDGERQLQVLNNVDLTLHHGQMVAIVGSSGSGKSTLLHCLGGLDQPSSGAVFYQGQAINRWSANQQADWRNQALGFVYQFHHLLPEFTALENVAMPLLIGKQPMAIAKQRALDLLTRVGLATRIDHKPSELSGGERQRVAIARALVTNPACVLMDEPTGNLDSHAADAIQALMLELNQSIGTSFVVVTYDLRLAARMDRILTLVDGAFVDDEDPFFVFAIR